MSEEIVEEGVVAEEVAPVEEAVEEVAGEVTEAASDVPSEETL